MIRVSAPAKCILIGEHSVVYGKPAIIAAVGKRCVVSASPSADVRIESRELGIRERFDFGEVIAYTEHVNTLWLECFEQRDFSRLFHEVKKDTNMLKAAAGKVIEQLSLKQGVAVRIRSDIPLGAGLGSGAALSVAMAKAVGEARGLRMGKARVNAVAFEVEKFMHGTPSGGDNTACCYGGTVWFEKGVAENVRAPPFLGRVVLVHSGKPDKTTGELVQHVRSLPGQYRTKRVDRLGRLARAMRGALAANDERLFIGIINEAQQLLGELGVSTKRIDALAGMVREIGGAAKVCGAGAGGIVLCYHPDRARLMRHLAGYDVINAPLGAGGVRNE